MSNTRFTILIYFISFTGLSYGQQSSQMELDSLKTVLEKIYDEDQGVRIKAGEIMTSFGRESNEMKEHLIKIRQTDSVNLIAVKTILDKYGWLSDNQVGSKASMAPFLVIQHADLASQESFLPLMEQAVEEGKAKASNLALLVDRVLLRQGKRQVYGSQIGRDVVTGQNIVLPLQDPKKVDKRRADVGLPSMQEYLSKLNMTWDVEAYIEELPVMEKRLKDKGNKY